MKDEGSIWVTLDDNYVHYVKILMDEIFGIKNFICHIVYKHRLFGGFGNGSFVRSHTHLLVFGKSKNVKLNKRSRSGEKPPTRYKDDNDGLGPFYLNHYYKRSAGILPLCKLEVTDPSTGKRYEIWGTHSQATVDKLLAENRLVFKNDRVLYKTYWSEAKKRPAPITTWWDDIQSTADTSKSLERVVGGHYGFTTPKPENLLHKILSIASDPGDLVVDIFGGSGTTAAVAQKMGRKWLVAEIGDHCLTLLKKRLLLVMNGKDPHGVTPQCKYMGGGGFKLTTLK